MDVVAKAQEGSTALKRRWNRRSEVEVNNRHADNTMDQLLTIQPSVNPVEAYAYDQLAPQLEKQGLFLPTALYFLDQSTATVQEPLPYIQLTEQLNYLTKLHNAEVQLDHAKLAVHEWLPEHNQMALACFNPVRRRLLAAMLDSLCYDFQHLFTPVSLIAGDCRLAHWLRNKEGVLMLANFQQMSLGSPAIDLASMLTALPTLNDCHQMAQAYLQINQQFKRSVEKLTADILAAAIWLKIDKCRLMFCGCDNVSQLDKDFYFDQVPCWLVDLMSHQIRHAQSA